MVEANSSLPVPVSPVTSTLESDRAAWDSRLKLTLMDGDSPTTPARSRSRLASRASFSSWYLSARPSVRDISRMEDGLSR